MNWLLLRGLTREQRHWGPFKEVFARTFPDGRIHCLDLPGVGTEYSRRSPTDMPALMMDLRTRWLELRARTEGPWALLAISLGGMAGMEWAARFPSDFTRFVLINSSAANLNHPLLRLRGQMLGAIARAALNRDPLAKERNVLAMTTNLPASVTAELAREWAGYAREYPMRRPVALAQLAAAVRFRAPAQLGVPTLILNSAKDRFTSPECSCRLAAHFGVPLVVHPTAGHDLPLEDPQWVADQVRRWLWTSA